VSSSPCHYATRTFIQKTYSNYSDFNCQHTANTEMTDDLRAYYLNFHNNQRRRLARGNSPARSGKFNKAKNMYKLEWSCSIEELAKRAVANCNADLTENRSYGQNLAGYTFWSSDGNVPRSHIKIKELIKKTLESWFNQAKEQGWKDPNNKFTNSGIYAFANMANSKTTEIGCAHNICKGNTKVQILCLYNRVGTFTGASIYRTGKPCQKNSDCTVFPQSTCDGHGLCIKKREEPDDKTNTMCPRSSSTMTDKVRQKFLNLHNHYRSLVATGRTYDKLLGKNTPKAAKMQKLKYSCELEATAWRYSQQCRFAHSTYQERNNAGENLYKNSIPRFDKLKVASMSTEDWFEEVEDFGIGGAANFSTRFSDSGHYTQMVWQDTRQLGCAIQDCPGMTLVVCHYKKAGNYIDEPVYTAGRPCSQCGNSELCNPNEGLCYST
ncbi:unnamed protein product, partial [Nippostrongylus brasiliensis]|uniref:SCP-like protein n=1 Tax=Nippostrongylus brasiliensis TaxID=27835 RepID=A0A0N4XEW2_NIPBR